MASLRPEDAVLGLGPTTATCHEYGDAGLLVEFEGASYADRWAAARALGRALRRSSPAGMVDVVTGFETVFVELDPLRTDNATIGSQVIELVRAESNGTGSGDAPPRLLHVPVVYGGEHGPDLGDVAALLGLSLPQVVDLHTAAPWTVRFVGSPLGAPMLDGIRLPAPVPRRASPRVRLAPGSVGVSGAQTIIYNAASPGGWQLLGRTPLALFSLDPPHVYHQAGDLVHFEPVGSDSWTELAGMDLRTYQERR